MNEGPTVVAFVLHVLGITLGVALGLLVGAWLIQQAFGVLL
jgi:hypothetical protein